MGGHPQVVHLAGRRLARASPGAQRSGQRAWDAGLASACSPSSAPDTSSSPRPPRAAAVLSGSPPTGSRRPQHALAAPLRCRAAAPRRRRLARPGRRRALALALALAAAPRGPAPEAPPPARPSPPPLAAPAPRRPSPRRAAVAPRSNRGGAGRAGGPSPPLTPTQGPPGGTRAAARARPTRARPGAPRARPGANANASVSTCLRVRTSGRKEGGAKNLKKK